MRENVLRGLMQLFCDEAAR